jgi:hypothetical protein
MVDPQQTANALKQRLGMILAEQKRDLFGFGAAPPGITIDFPMPPITTTLETDGFYRIKAEVVIDVGATPQDPN